MRDFSSDGSLPASTLVSSYILPHDGLLAPTVLDVKYYQLVPCFAWHEIFLMMEAFQQEP